MLGVGNSETALNVDARKSACVSYTSGFTPTQARVPISRLRDRDTFALLVQLSQCYIPACTCLRSFFVHMKRTEHVGGFPAIRAVWYLLFWMSQSFGNDAFNLA